MRSRRLLILAALVASVPFTSDAAETPPRVFLLGGSTLAESRPPSLIRGWGQAFGAHFTAPGLVRNHAAGGRSSKSFIDQGRWAAVVAELRAGDWVIAQFGGGNDAKREDPARYTDPATTYRDNLRRIVAETRARGAHPILATMGAIRAWDAQGRFVSLPTPWVEATRAVAGELAVPLLDLRARTEELEASLGPAGSVALHLHLPPGKHPGHPQGAQDDTHYSELGAARVATLAADEIRRLHLPLARWLAPHASSSARPPGSQR
ncbi:MAG: rhamnogalacturonan acetylesterase [Opitutaceae bacterium]|nr:rhamnogalacturonan acetylesterase [Opitutaceae bacterium]